MEDTTKVLQLRHSLMTTKGEVHEITLREPTLDELEKASKQTGVHASNRYLIAAVTGIEAPFIGKLAARDYYDAVAYLEGFLSPAPATEGEAA